MTDNKNKNLQADGQISDFEKELAKVLDLDNARMADLSDSALASWRIDPNEALYLIIDIQERLAPVIHEHKEVEANALILAKAFEALGAPIIVSEQYPKGLGPTVPELKEACDQAGAEYYEKTRFTAVTPNILRAIRKTGRGDIVISGMETHICVWQTAIDLLSLGYRVYIAEDAVGSRKPEHKARALANMEDYGVIISPVETLLYEMLLDSKHPAFKTISKLIK